MRMGIHPPLSGAMNNLNKDSNGAWIRTEIWASLCPGNPSLAAKYAYEDASVDHTREGIYSAVFFAAVQSAAFFESDTFKLIDIGLSYIPEDCGVARAIKVVLDCYNSKKDWKEARKAVLIAEPGSFGMIGGYWQGQDYEKTIPLSDKYPPQQPEPDVPAGKPGYDAPSNVALAVIGWVYGEGDFEKSILISANCGEDADCTAGNLGSTLGIILGKEKLPAKWVDNCSEKIATWCLRIDAGLRLPKTVSQLTDRIVRQTPAILGPEKCDITAPEGYVIYPQNSLITRQDKDDKAMLPRTFRPTRTRNQIFFLYDVQIKYDGALAKIEEGVEKKLSIKFKNNLYDPQYLTVRFIDVPDDWAMPGGKERCVNIENIHGGKYISDIEISFIPQNLNRGKYSIIMEISSHGRMTKNYIPLTFINGYSDVTDGEIDEEKNTVCSPDKPFNCVHPVRRDSFGAATAERD